MVAVFVFLGFWQLSRLGERQATNAVIESRIERTVSIADLGALPDTDAGAAELDYQAVTARLTYVEPDQVRIANRSQGGAAGEWVVAIARLADGSELAVNRGFVPVNADVELATVPSGPVTVDGWLRKTVTRESFGAVDAGEGTVLPRLDTERVSTRLERPLPMVYLQVAPPERSGGRAVFPDPVMLAPLDEGPHRSYAVQWFIFATLGVGFYLALLSRRSRGDERVDDVPG